jgi:hypothetical protein
VLDPSSPADAATTGDNVRDNSEQVYLDSPASGTYLVTVTHKGTLADDQVYSIASSLPLGPGGDTEAPVVTVTVPNGGEVWDIGLAYDITWTAIDNVGVTSIDILLSADGGATYPDTIAAGEANDGIHSWMVDADATTQARIKVIAYDAVLNSGEDVSDADFEIYDPLSGIVDEPQIPSRLVIVGASPNPFSRSTVIRFGIPTAGPVRLDIYDVSGRLVDAVPAQVFPGGYHSVTWSNPASLSMGLYVIRLQFGAEELTHKVVVSR